MRKTFIAAILAVLIAGFVLGGCGGGDDEPTLTKAEFIEQGDQICKENYEEREELLMGYLAEAKAKGKLPPLSEQEAILVDEVLPIFQIQSEELEELGLPKAGTARAEEILAGLEAAIQGVEDQPRVAIEKGSKVNFAAVEKMARDYGFKYCGRS